MPRAYVSPISTATIIFGIIFLAVAPPLGIILLVWAFVIQGRHRGGIRAARQAAHDAAVEKARMKLRREKAEAYRWFGAA